MTEKKIKEIFLQMKRLETIDFVKEQLRAGTDPFAIIEECRAAMEEVGKNFETGKFFLSELIYSAEVFKAVTAILEPRLVSNQSVKETQGEIVFGTPQGDTHDLGKNIVITMMRSQGFIVHDLGVDVPPHRFIEKIRETEAPVLALSALITPAFDSMQEIISILKDKGLRENTFLIIGGGVTNEFARKEIGADAQTLDPTEAIRLCTQYIQIKKETPMTET